MTQNTTDFENQVVNLVKAAMSGDEEANDVIVQIIEAAKKGDEQALKVVALIKQLTQSNSDQAEEGAEEENTEVMKCGGKVRAKMKAKKSAEKKEEGGEIPEEKCGGTAKKMRKVACKAKKCEEGDKLTDTQKFLLGAKCGCKVKKAKKVKKGENGVQLPEGAHGQTWSKSTSSTTVFSKGGKQCPCALKRIGGKIVTVDTCTGLPIHKQGGSIKKYQNPAHPIVFGTPLTTEFYYYPETKKFYIGSLFKKKREATWDEIKNIRGSQEFIDKLYRAKYLYPTEGLYIDKDENTGKVVWSKTGRFPSIYSKGWKNQDNLRMHYNDGTYIINPGEDNEETLTFSEYYDRYPDDTQWLARYNNVGYRGEEIPYKEGKAQWDPAQQKYVYKIYRTVSAPATESEESTEGSASASAASQSATAATAGSSTTAQQGATTSTTSTSTGTSSQSGSKYNFAEWLKQNAPQYQSYSERKKLAEKYGIQNYTGSLQQNLQMWERMKNDQTLNSQASPEAAVIREATRVAPLPVPIIPASKKVEFPTIRLANRKTPQAASLPNEGTEYETPQRTYQQRLSQVEY